MSSGLQIKHESAMQYSGKKPQQIQFGDALASETQNFEGDCTTLLVLSMS